MKIEERKRLLNEQPKSHLHHKDLNTFDAFDFHCLKKGIILKCHAGRKPQKNLPKFKGKIEVTYNGIAEIFDSVPDIMDKLGISRGVAQYGIKHGKSNKGEMKFKKIEI